MSAVAIQATVPFYGEAAAYWDELTLQCRRHVNAINAVVANHRKPQDQEPENREVGWRSAASTMSMNREAYPSTEVQLRLIFEQWGPKIAGTVRGYQDENLRFYPEEFEFPIGSDQDGNTIAITSEGRDLTPHQLAKFVAQNFRRCYPGLTLPSPDGPLE